MATRSRAEGAVAHLKDLVRYGVGLNLIGGLIMALAWPRTSSDFTGTSESGNAVLALLGAAVAWGGSMFLLVGLVGFGVRLGREASPTTG